LFVNILSQNFSAGLTTPAKSGEFEEWLNQDRLSPKGERNK